MKHLVLTLLISIIFYMPAKAQIFDLSSNKKTSGLNNQQLPCVYKPSKLVIGSKSKFIIKARPGSNVSLLTSNKNSGSRQLYGKKLRLGSTINAFEGIIPENGVLELEVPLPEEEELVGQILYFEVIVGKGENFDDMKTAKIMGIDGRETDTNAVIITAAPKNTSLPGFGAMIPGTNLDINRTMDAINRSKKYNDEDSDNFYSEQTNYSNYPLMLRNLRVPETKKD